MGKCSARRKARFMCTFRTPRQTPSTTAKCILSSSFFTPAMPWRLEAVEHTLPGTWDGLVLPDMGGKFDKVKERLLAGSSLFLFSIVVSIPTISFHSKRPETTAKCILSSSFFTQAMPWRLEGVEPTFPGTWEWLVLPDMGGKFDKVKERLLAGSS